MVDLREICDQLDEHLGTTSLLPSDLETQFSRFSAVNVVPGHHEIPLIHAVVAQRNIQLSALALQLANVDTAITKLVAIRAKLEENSALVRRSLHAHQTLTSPARRIPPEVLSEVFCHCLPRMPYITPSAAECPMVLTQVCRHWRAVAISTPRLWFSFSIDLQKTACDKYRRGCELWFARAKSVPLAIRVLNNINMFAADTTQVSSVLHWLRPLISHCNDLWWYGHSLTTLFNPDTESEIDLPLERLYITTLRDPPTIQFPGSPRFLRSAYLHCINYDLQSLDEIKLPWDHLVELNMHFALFSSTLFLQLLARCSHLHTVVASCLCANQVQLGALGTLSRGSIIHPTLRRIEIRVIRAGLDMIFDAVTLPALEELDVCFCYRERDAWPHGPFLEMVRRSRCKLKRLTVRSNKTAVQHFGEYMEVMPGLAIFTSSLSATNRLSR